MRFPQGHIRSAPATTAFTAAAISAVILVVSSSIASMSPRAENRIRPDLSEADAKRVARVTRPATDFTKAEPFEAMSAGAATAHTSGRDAFSSPAANLGKSTELDFVLGEALFEKIWVSSPASTKASDGLGPLFNGRSCARCHIRDGRGRAPDGPDDRSISTVLHLSVPPANAEEHARLAANGILALPEPTYGHQLQEFAVTGLPAEGRAEVRYEEIPVDLAGGETVTLRKPAYRVSDPGYGPLHPETRISARIAPAMIGLGLLEAIAVSDILAAADPDDADGDGISGRPHWLVSRESGEPVLGRYGWKATMPSVAAQSAAAFSTDIGISTPMHPAAAGDCTESQTNCRTMPSGVQDNLGTTEAPDPVMDLVTFYTANLAVPARHDVDDADVLAGKRVFHDAGCASCHRPKYVTRRDAPEPAHRFQLIWPFTDLLLHDMGDGLADTATVGDASGHEWKTPPLWGLGRMKTVGGDVGFLHDGRARTLIEAVLWHGGEAQSARDTVVALPPSDRAALIRFLESL
ncbi:MAG: thiol oxidoreductase [Hyphomicrobiales bacterium]|nr:MAG: thiol oxidoreductase [Hyphomicrobiales bacterium]